MARSTTTEEDTSKLLVDAISAAIKIPGVKVNRSEFLRSEFRNEPPEKLNRIVALGPVSAGCPQKQLRKLADDIVFERTLASSGMSFAAGLPGGFGAAATIPADTVQFFGVALRMAQEIAYLYGESDYWADNEVDKERVQSRLILDLGVMYGVNGSASAIKFLNSKLGRNVLGRFSKKAVSNAFYVPIGIAITKTLGLQLSKSLLSHSLAKIVPVLGGIANGTITFASMQPMGNRLTTALDKAAFSYTAEDYRADVQEILRAFNLKLSDSALHVVVPDGTQQTAPEAPAAKPEKSLTDKILEAKKLLDDGVITEEEFQAIKAKYISEL